MTERFIISGRLDGSLLPWIDGHARRIGVAVDFGPRSDSAMELRVDGPPALLDAMEMGCLLGPIDVWIEDIRREPV
ncbi:acylphosphatase [Paracoccus sp. 1_MG-2023]|uniref:acylphosphatase n=1 Tax=unclassified Paracoccus (in: a-proteobacteria) TaxID=2688777 RepID=UPI001C08A283|nr:MULTISPECIES: acylphosphatase [unclassified Paracoccus (in: a-proteobacteria)]MBU2957974.1 acylphosphatase [Paracoccus sp. C2R09]MDO6668832.1 acylphosphatase [Paracoccus sp. 1_MG-2023]